MLMSHCRKACEMRDIIVAIFEIAVYHYLLYDHKYANPSCMKNPHFSLQNLIPLSIGFKSIISSSKSCPLVDGASQDWYLRYSSFNVFSLNSKTYKLEKQFPLFFIQRIIEENKTGGPQ